MGGNNSVLLLNTLYCTAAAKIQTTGTSGEESLLFSPGSSLQHVVLHCSSPLLDFFANLILIFIVVCI